MTDAVAVLVAAPLKGRLPIRPNNVRTGGALDSDAGSSPVASQDGGDSVHDVVGRKMQRVAELKVWLVRPIRTFRHLDIFVRSFGGLLKPYHRAFAIAERSSPFSESPKVHVERTIVLEFHRGVGGGE